MDVFFFYSVLTQVLPGTGIRDWDSGCGCSTRLTVVDLVAAEWRRRREGQRTTTTQTLFPGGASFVLPGNKDKTARRKQDQESRNWFLVRQALPIGVCAMV